MTITLSNLNNMRSDFQALEAGTTREYALSVLKVLGWMLESEESGDLILGRWDTEDGPVTLTLDATGKRGNRYYRIVIESSDGMLLWDVVDQKIRRARNAMESGKARNQLSSDSKIEGSLVEALNEVEKTRIAI